MEAKKKMYDRWTDEEVLGLLTVFAEDDIQRDFESATRNDKVYEKISRRLANTDIYHSGKQCREKMKKLKQDYKETKDHNNRSGSDRRTSKWYDRLDAILGHRPAFSGTAATKDSATAILEAMCAADCDKENDGEDENGLEVNVAEASASNISLFAPATASSPRPSSSADARPRGKRKRDDSFIEALRESEEANRAASVQQSLQSEQIIRHMVNSQAEEMELRRQELAFLQTEMVESRASQREFQTGFLAVLRQLAQSLVRENQPAPAPAPPLD